MRSTEKTQLGTDEFVAPEGLAVISTLNTTLLARFRTWLDKASPVTLAVGATAFVAAGLFVAVDTVHSLDEAGKRLDYIARAFAAELSVLPPEAAATALERSADEIGVGFIASLHAPGGNVVATSAPIGAGFGQLSAVRYQPLKGAAAAGGLNTLSVSFDHGAALGGTMIRGLVAFAIAFITTVAAARRRRIDMQTAQDNDDDLQSFVSAVPFGVACWSERGEMVSANPLFRDLAGETPASNYHSAIWQLNQGGSMRVIDDEGSTRLMELHRDDGKCLLVDERPLTDGGFVTFVIDVTEKKRADKMLSTVREEQRQLARRFHEEKLKAEAASRSKTSFLAHLSHDIRTPLNHIIGFADLISHQTYGPLGDARYLDYVDTIKNAGERLLTSFATILELAELEGGRRVLREEAIPVDELIVSITQRFSNQAQRAGLTLGIQARADAVIHADRYCLERMLGNIVDNSIRFTPSGGQVTLAAFAATDGVVIEVTDTGLGMTEEQIANLSQPFVLGDAAFAREHGGMGLGIAIARAIAQLSGGMLAIDSSPAMGTTVAISLPRAKAESAEQVVAA